MNKLKEYGLHFRYRNYRNELFDVGLVTQAKSQKDAKTTGKLLERPEEKVCFIGLIDVSAARATGGHLP